LFIILLGVCYLLIKKALIFQLIKHSQSEIASPPDNPPICAIIPLMETIPNIYTGLVKPVQKKNTEPIPLDYAYSNVAAEIDTGIRETIKGVRVSTKMPVTKFVYYSVTTKNLQ